MYKICFLSMLFALTFGDTSAAKRTVLKPISACCDIPDLGIPTKTLSECTLPGPCNDVKCAFEKLGITNGQVLNKEAYRNHFHQWVETHKGWADAVDKALEDCVDKEIRQYLDYPCRAYDVFTCTSIAMLKRCPKEAWKC